MMIARFYVVNSNVTVKLKQNIKEPPICRLLLLLFCFSYGDKDASPGSNSHTSLYRGTTAMPHTDRKHNSTAYNRVSEHWSAEVGRLTILLSLTILLNKSGNKWPARDRNPGLVLGNSGKGSSDGDTWLGLHKRDRVFQSAGSQRRSNSFRHVSIK